MLKNLHSRFLPLWFARQVCILLLSCLNLFSQSFIYLHLVFLIVLHHTLHVSVEFINLFLVWIVFYACSSPSPLSPIHPCTQKLHFIPLSVLFSFSPSTLTIFFSPFHNLLILRHTQMFCIDESTFCL